jgi:hypothetical protein
MNSGQTSTDSLQRMHIELLQGCAVIQTTASALHSSGSLSRMNITAQQTNTLLIYLSSHYKKTTITRQEAREYSLIHKEYSP